MEPTQSNPDFQVGDLIKLHERFYYGTIFLVKERWTNEIWKLLNLETGKILTIYLKTPYSYEIQIVSKLVP